MALSDLKVFTDWTYLTITEVLRQQVQLFNAASQGTIILREEPFTGDYKEAAYWQKLTGIVRRRDPYVTTSVSTIELAHLTDRMVKIAAGTPEIRIDPSQFSWIQRSPEEAGVVIGRQLAVETLADMLNVAISAGVAALKNVSDVYLDATTEKMDISVFNDGQALFGDHYQDIRAWIMHSKPLFDLFGNTIANSNSLFLFETINVRQDGFGRVFVITDSASLINATPSPDQYYTLGLVPQAVMVERQNDFDDTMVEATGSENIKRTYQAEWSYGLGLKGFAWDSTNGGKAPNDAEIATAGNWDKIATSHKDLAGVVIETL